MKKKILFFMFAFVLMTSLLGCKESKKELEEKKIKERQEAYIPFETKEDFAVLEVALCKGDKPTKENVFVMPSGIMKIYEGENLKIARTKETEKIKENDYLIHVVNEFFKIEKIIKHNKNEITFKYSIPKKEEVIKNGKWNPNVIIAPYDSLANQVIGDDHTLMKPITDGEYYDCWEDFKEGKIIVRLNANFENTYPVIKKIVSKTNKEIVLNLEYPGIE